MGIPDSELLNPEHVAESLRCPICSEVLLDPMECRQCLGTFCKLCVQSTCRTKLECPHCYETTQRLIPARRKIRTHLNQLQVRCQHEGCSWSGRLKSRSGHECELLPAVIANNGAALCKLASQSLRIAELERHVLYQQELLQIQERHREELSRQHHLDQLIIAEMVNEAHGRHERLREYLQHGRLRPRDNPCNLQAARQEHPSPAWSSSTSPWTNGEVQANPPFSSMMDRVGQGFKSDATSNQCPNVTPAMFYYVAVPQAPSHLAPSEEQ